MCDQLLIQTFIESGPPKLFLIDTGTSTTMISAEAARTVTKVHEDPRANVHGIQGTVKHVYRAERAVLQFANLRQENQELVAVDLSQISRNAGVEVSGVLGFNVLNQLEVEIDCRDGLVNFVFDPKRLPAFGR